MYDCLDVPEIWDVTDPLDAPLLRLKVVAGLPDLEFRPGAAS